MADMVFTDPPYNVNYEGKTKEKLKIQNDKMSPAAFRRFLLDAFSAMAAVTRPGGAFYVCHADIEAVNFRETLSQAGWLLKQSLIWVKNQFILGRQDYHWQHEPILYGWRDGGSHRWHGDRKQSTVIEATDLVAVAEVEGGHQLSISDGVSTVVIQVPSYEILSSAGPLRETIWRVPKPLRNGEHPTMKPVALVSLALKNSAANGGVVLDPFSGSGATLIACEKDGRVCRANELDPKYCDVIIRRWENFTGRKAERIEG